MAKTEYAEIEAGERTVRVSNPSKMWFPGGGHTKLDTVRYFVAVGDGVLRALRNRPTVMRRFPDGAGGEDFYQKRVPKGTPEWIPRARVRFPSGRVADELCPSDVSHIAWAVNLGSFELHPWPVRNVDVDHPDMLRVDLDPQQEIGFEPIREVVPVVREVLVEHGLTGFPKTSGNRGLHVLVPVEPEHGFATVRRAALALAREVERRLPHIVTSKWWKEERGAKVFVDFNQNARDRTIVSTYSVRSKPAGPVSTPIGWDEVATVDPQSFTIATVPERFAEVGDLHADIDAPQHRGTLAGLLALADEDEAKGLGDAPWPPHYGRQDDEPHRAPPSVSRRLKDARSAAGIVDGEKSAERRPAVIFDLDGVLASVAWRQHLVEGKGKKDWDGFFAGIPRDAAVPEMCDLLRTAASAGADVLVVSGRPERTRADTEAWFGANGIGGVYLFLRADDDRRPDHIVKRELFEALIEPRWEVREAFEDRWRVAAVWQSFQIPVRVVEDPALAPSPATPTT